MKWTTGYRVQEIDGKQAKVAMTRFVSSGVKHNPPPSTDRGMRRRSRRPVRQPAEQLAA